MKPCQWCGTYGPCAAGCKCSKCRNPDRFNRYKYADYPFNTILSDEYKTKLLTEDAETTDAETENASQPVQPGLVVTSEHLLMLIAYIDARMQNLETMAESLTQLLDHLSEYCYRLDAVEDAVEEWITSYYGEVR